MNPWLYNHLPGFIKRMRRSTLFELTILVFATGFSRLMYPDNHVEQDTTFLTIIAVIALVLASGATFGKIRVNGSQYKYTAHWHDRDNRCFEMSGDNKKACEDFIKEAQRQYGVYDPTDRPNGAENG